MRIGVEEVSAPQTVTPIRPPPTTSTEIPIPTPVERPEPPPVVSALFGPSPAETALAVVVTAFMGLGFALSARAILLLVLIGGFALGALVMQTPSVIRLLALIAYGVLAILPCVWLEKTKGR